MDSTERAEVLVKCRQRGDEKRSSIPELR